MVIWDGSNYRIGKLWPLSTIPVPLASVICALCRSHQCQLVEKACRLTFLPSVARETCARMQGFSSMPSVPSLPDSQPASPTEDHDHDPTLSVRRLRNYADLLGPINVKSTSSLSEIRNLAQTGLKLSISPLIPLHRQEHAAK